MDYLSIGANGQSAASIGAHWQGLFTPAWWSSMCESFKLLGQSCFRMFTVPDIDSGSWFGLSICSGFGWGGPVLGCQSALLPVVSFLKAFF